MQLKIRSTSSMQHQEVINKLVVLHRIKLPEDIINEICGYCFYDTETSLYRQTKRNLILSAFTNSSLSCGYDLQHWWFWINSDGNINPQFQCVFCSQCGNYLMSNNGETIANQAICECAN